MFPKMGDNGKSGLSPLNFGLAGKQDFTLEGFSERNVAITEERWAGSMEDPGKTARLSIQKIE